MNVFCISGIRPSGEVLVSSLFLRLCHGILHRKLKWLKQDLFDLNSWKRFSVHHWRNSIMVWGIQVLHRMNGRSWVLHMWQETRSIEKIGSRLYYGLQWSASREPILLAMKAHYTYKNATHWDQAPKSWVWWRY